MEIVREHKEGFVYIYRFSNKQLVSTIIMSEKAWKMRKQRALDELEKLLNCV